MSLLEDIANHAPKSIFDLEPDLVKEIQTCLVAGKYLTPQEIDGVVGDKTVAAYAKFKADVWLEHPEQIGPTTAKALLDLQQKRSGTQEASNYIPKQPLDFESLGKKTGLSMALPDGVVVFANELIVENVPLTWGEVTANCTRKPTQNAEVVNAIELAKRFGEVREKFGSPIGITSGFRPPNVNRAVGGVSNSQHVFFKALDIYPLNGDFASLWQILKASKFGGLGDGVSTGKGFYHVDTRYQRVIFGY